MTETKINLHTVYLSTCMEPRGLVTIEDYDIRLLYSWYFNNNTRNKYYNSLILLFFFSFFFL